MRGYRCFTAATGMVALFVLLVYALAGPLDYADTLHAYVRSEARPLLLVLGAWLAALAGCALGRKRRPT